MSKCSLQTVRCSCFPVDDSSHSKVKSKITLQTTNSENHNFPFIKFCSAIISFYNLKFQEECENLMCLLLKLQEVTRSNMTKKIIIIHTELSNYRFRAWRKGSEGFLGEIRDSIERWWCLNSIFFSLACWRSLPCW